MYKSPDIYFSNVTFSILAEQLGVKCCVSLRPGIDHAILSLLGLVWTKPLFFATMLSSWVSLSLLCPAALRVTARCAVSSFFTSSDWLDLSRSLRLTVGRGISPRPTLILWHLVTADGGIPSTTHGAAYCCDNMVLCSYPLTHESSFMVQFIWHLIRCTSTSEKHKLGLQMKQLLNLKANEIKRQWNEAFAVLYMRHFRCSNISSQHRNYSLDWAVGGSWAGFLMQMLNLTQEFLFNPLYRTDCRDKSVSIQRKISQHAKR